MSTECEHWVPNSNHSALMILTSAEQKLWRIHNTCVNGRPCGDFRALLMQYSFVHEAVYTKVLMDRNNVIIFNVNFQMFTYGQ